MKKKETIPNLSKAIPANTFILLNMDILGPFKFFFITGMVILTDSVELDLLALGLGVSGWRTADVLCILLCMLLDLLIICLGFVLTVSKELAVLVLVKDKFASPLLVMLSCCVWTVWV